MSKRAKAILSVLTSLSVSGGYFVNASEQSSNVQVSDSEVQNIENEKTISNGQKKYTKKDFEISTRMALNDVFIRLNTVKKGENLYHTKYVAHVYDGKKIEKIEIVSPNSAPGNFIENIRYIVDQGISLLNEGKKIFCPTSGQLIYMPSAAKELMNKWKKDGVYDSKIDSIIDLHINTLWPGLNDLSTEMQFDDHLKILLSDIRLRMRFSYRMLGGAEYTLKLADGQIMTITCPEGMDGVSNDKVYRYIVDKVLDELEKKDIMIPSLDMKLSISPKIQNLINIWKREGMYNSKINSIIARFMDACERDLKKSDQIDSDSKEVSK